MGLLEIIKQAGVGAVEAGYPVAILLGKVVSAEPLEIQLDQRDTLPASFLLVPERLTPYSIDVRHTHAYEDRNGSGTTGGVTEESLPEPLVIRRGLEAGDSVLLLRMQGGQQFVVLDRLVAP